MMHVKALLTVLSLLFFYCPAYTQSLLLQSLPEGVKLYPELNRERPDLPSPFVGSSGEEYLIAVNKDGWFGIIPVTLRNTRDIVSDQLYIDTIDFPALSRNGLHQESLLTGIRKITGRSIEEINKLARPGGLSTYGFLAEDEDIRATILGDNHLVQKMGLRHPELAKPLFHVLNMMDEDLALNRWNMAKHQWDHIKYFYYNTREIQVLAFDTKGGQRSVFDDGIMGAFHIQLWRELDQKEMAFLSKHYQHLSEPEFALMLQRLSFINTGEMEPQYIMRYGFYEGHTFWRADPVAIALIFGLRPLEQLHEIYKGKLDEVLGTHFVSYP